jgi:hypothetical protein
VRPLYANEKIPLVDLENTIFALDSTSISVSINLAAWASGKYSRGAVKMHTLLDLRGSIPTFIYISDGVWHDSNLLDCLDFEPNAIYTMDKAYVDLVALDKINSIGAYFVTRARAIMRYRVIEDRTCYEDGILTDQLVVFTGYKSSHLYPNALRMIRYHDIETNETLIFISNNMDISALDIANIYRNRWQIEVFFKWVKQNMTIKRMWGYSENAIRTHLWIAIISYLLIAKIKAELQTPYSITEVARILGVSAFAKIPIRELLAEPQSTIENQNVKELKLF